MDRLEQLRLFNLLTPEQVNQLRNMPVEACCHFEIVQGEAEIVTSFWEQNKHTWIQIRGNYILQCRSSSEEILSGLFLNYFINFQTIQHKTIKKNHFGQNSQKSISLLRVLSPRLEKQDKNNVFVLQCKEYQLISTDYINYCSFKNTIAQKTIILTIQDLKLHYKPQKVVSTGNNSKSFIGTEIKSNKKKVIKAYSRQVLQNNHIFINIIEELNILHQLSHKCIVKAQKVMMTNNSLYIITQHYQFNLKMFNHIFDDRLHNTQLIIHSILQTLQFLHKNKIVGQVLTPEKILINLQNKRVNAVAITDFLAIRYLASQKIGSGFELTSDMEKSQYQEFEDLLKCDFKATAFILYFLLTGKNIIQSQLKIFNCEHEDQELIQELQSYKRIPKVAVKLFKYLMGQTQKKFIAAQQNLQHIFVKQAIQLANKDRNWQFYQEETEQFEQEKTE